MNQEISIQKRKRISLLVLENSLVNLDRNKERRASDGLSNPRI